PIPKKSPIGASTEGYSFPSQYIRNTNFFKIVGSGHFSSLVSQFSQNHPEKVIHNRLIIPGLSCSTKTTFSPGLIGIAFCFVFSLKVVNCLETSLRKV